MRRIAITLFFIGTFISLSAATDFQPNMIPYYSFKTKLWGVSDSTGKIIIPVKYEEIDLPTSGLAICRLPLAKRDKTHNAEQLMDVYRSDGTLVTTVRYVQSFERGFAITIGPNKYGMVDSTGNIVLPAIYDYVTEVKEGFISCLSGTTWSIVNAKGRVIASSDTIKFSNFYKGRAWVESRSGRLGSMDSEGKILWHKKQYAFARTSGSFAVVRNNEMPDNTGMVDYFGNEIVPLKFSDVGYSGSLIITDLKGKKGIYSRNGKEILSPEYDRIEPLRSNSGDDETNVYGFTGLSEKYLRVQWGEGWLKRRSGVIDTTGKMIIPMSDWWIMSVYDGIFKMGAPQTQPGKYKWGFMDSTGAEIAPLIYERVTGFRYGVGAVQDSSGYHLIDRKGKQIGKEKYDLIRIVYPINPDSLFLVNSGKQYGLVNTRGEIVVPLLYDFIVPREKGRLIVQKTEQNKKVYGVVSYTGKELWPVKFSWIGCFRNGYGWATLDSQLVVVDSVGNVTQPAKGCRANDAGSGMGCDPPYYATCKTGDSTTFVNERGEIIPQLLPYDRVRVRDNFTMVRAGDKWGVMDFRFNLILPVEYSGIFSSPSPTVFLVQLEPKGTGVFVNTNGTKYYEK